ncbi:MAG: anti-sigma factor family protein [Isosphaerales bacterium]
MMSDDDSFLSAYMDGQLDPGQHEWVESALVSNPQLAEQLRGLTVLRDLVAGLARDTSVDVAPRVMERIRARQPVPRRFPAFQPWPPGRVPSFATIGILTTAAGIILAISLAVSHAPRLNRPDGTTGRGLTKTIDNAKSTATRTDAGATEGAQETRRSSSDISLSSDGAASTLASGGEAHISSVFESTGSATSRDLERYRQFLDNPNLRRSFLVRSGHDGRGEQLVATVIERTTRFGFFKSTVSQGIVIDPRHPEEVTVFVLLVNPKEVDRLRDQLKVAFSDLIEETPVDPAIVTQLTDIGQVEAFHPAPLADVLIPREALALRTGEAGATENTGPPASPEKQSGHNRPTIEQEQSAKRLAAARPGSSSDTHSDAARTSGAASIARPSEGPHDTIVVLVWVCKPRS